MDKSGEINLVELLALGFEELPATCNTCRYTWRWPIYFVPAELSLEQAIAVAACPKCDSRKISVEIPNIGTA